MFNIVQVVPTGIGARIGGFVGDATPATNLLASIADRVITHPNVVNGVELYLAKPNVLYVEGHTLDRFFLGEVALREVTSNKIGIVIDSGLKEKESLYVALNTIDAIETVKGIEIAGYTLTDKPVGVKAVKNKSGAFVGEIENIKTILDASRKLIENGAEAIAISTVIKIDKNDLYAYFKGRGPNPFGGVEAIISHIVSRKLQVPCAHAPLLTKEEMKLEMPPEVVDPRAGAEAVSPAYLGCAIQGLHKAPQIIGINDAEEGDLKIEDVSALLYPHNSLGGVPVLSAEKNNIPIIGVEENSTVLNVTSGKLGLKNVIRAKNYLEAAGIIAAMKEGIDFNTIERPVHKLRKI